MLISKFIATVLAFCIAGCPTVAVSATTSATTTMQTMQVETPKAETPKQVVERLVDKYALQYGVSKTRMLGTIRCENRNFDPTLQSGMRYPRDNKKWGVKAGEREKSFGLVMVHLPDHPDISYLQATDPEFAIEFMAQEFAKGHASQWTCWRNLYALQYKQDLETKTATSTS